MHTYRCPCCDEIAQCISSDALIFHPCPARNNDLRNFKLVKVVSKPRTSKPVQVEHLHPAEHFDNFHEDSLANTYRPVM